MSILTGPSIGQRIELAREFTISKLEKSKDNNQNETLNKIYGLLIDNLKLDESKYFDDFVFVNVAYDRELVPVLDNYGFQIGEIDVTDRLKLNEFLNRMGNSHKYILFDVLLSDKYQSPNDSLLIETLLNTERIAIARTENHELSDKRLEDKTGYTDYTTNILETNFVKYEFRKNGANTIASKAYKDLTGDNPVKQFGPFYFRDGHLQWKSMTLRFPLKLWNPFIKKDEIPESGMIEESIINLGQELEMWRDLEKLVKDKIVVIGDFTEDDIHTTYMGPIAGPVINANALEALLKNEQEIPWWLIGALFVLYAGITFFLLKQYKVFNLMKILRLNNPVLQEFVSFIGFSAFFAIIAGIIYLSSGKDINVLIPSLWFTVLRGIINFKWKDLKAYS